MLAAATCCPAVLRGIAAGVPPLAMRLQHAVTVHSEQAPPPARSLPMPTGYLVGPAAQSSQPAYGRQSAQLAYGRQSAQPAYGRQSMRAPSAAVQQVVRPAPVRTSCLSPCIQTSPAPVTYKPSCQLLQDQGLQVLRVSCNVLTRLLMSHLLQNAMVQQRQQPAATMYEAAVPAAASYLRDDAQRGDVYTADLYNTTANSMRMDQYQAAFARARGQQVYAGQ